MRSKKIETAIKPNKFTSFADLNIPKEATEEEAVVDKSEELLHGLYYHGGWEVLEESIRSQIRSLEDLAQTQIAAGASWEEIGKSTVILQICKAELLKVINRVEDAKETVESRERDTTTATGNPS